MNVEVYLIVLVLKGDKGIQMWEMEDEQKVVIYPTT